jgi:hypothetical protein
MPVSSHAPAAVVYTPEEMSRVLNDLVTAVQGIRLYLLGSHGPPQPLPPPVIIGLPALLWTSPFSATPAAFPGLQLQPPPMSSLSWQQWPSPLSTGPVSTTPGGVPIQQVRFPSSPSPLPAWLSGSSPPPVYTTTEDQPAPTLPDATTSGFTGPHAGCAELSGHGGTTPTPPRFAKIDFATYDGTTDPLNWLNQCEQFYRG